MALKNENAVAMMATIATEMKKKEERANNVIASIPTSFFNSSEVVELEIAKQLADTIKGQDEIKVAKARRISRQPDETAALLIQVTERSLRPSLVVASGQQSSR
jgi:hypothetical protein